MSASKLNARGGWSSYQWASKCCLHSFDSIPLHELLTKLDKPNQPKTPLFLYDPEIVTKNYRRIRDTFRNALSVRSRVLFATMCNRHPGILKPLIDEGGSFQVDSVTQLNHLLKLGCAPEKISATTANLSYEDMRYFADNNVFINFDSLEDIKKYIDLVDRNLIKGDKDIGIRVYTDYSKVVASNATNVPPPNADSRIGIKPEQYGQLQTLIKGKLRVVGVHGYSVSNELDPQLFINHARTLMDAIPDWMMDDIKFVNVGGGFGTPKTRDDDAFDWVAYAAGLSDVVTEFIKTTGKSAIEIEVEPGRAIVYDTAIGLFRVLAVKEMVSHTIVGLNGGTSQAPVFFIHGDRGRAPLGIVLEPGDERRNIPDQALAPVSFAGNSTLQGDYLARLVSFMRVYPECLDSDGSTKPGDLIVLTNVGAYQPMLAAGFPSGNKAPEYRIRRHSNGDWSVEPFPATTDVSHTANGKTERGARSAVN